MASKLERQTRRNSITSLKATLRYARNRDPGWCPDYIEKLPDDALAWLASYHAAADGHKDAQDLLGLTEEQRAALASDRYKRDEHVAHSSKNISVEAETTLGYLIDRATYEKQDHCPFAPGTAREAKRSPKRKLQTQLH